MATKKITKTNTVSLETQVYSKDGKAKGTITLPEEVFGAQWNADLVHQVVTAMQANARTPIAHSRTRGEVSGGGKKPWAQKGTGRARHGSTRSPIWRHGGKAHGPRNEKDYTQKINKKVKAKALFSAISKKYREGEILFIDAIAFPVPKAKDARAVLSAFGTIKGFEALGDRRKNAAYILTGAKNETLLKSFKNFGNVLVKEAKDSNPVELLSYKFVVIVSPEESVKALTAKLA